MKVIFSISYNTSWGESVVLCLGKKTYPMQPSPDGKWSVALSRVREGDLLSYGYRIVREDGSFRREWRHHSLSLDGVRPSKVLFVRDHWQDAPSDAPFYSTAFTKGIFRRTPHVAQTLFAGRTVILVNVPVVESSEQVCIVGTGEGMNSWKTPLPLDDSGFPQWRFTCDQKESFEYKFVITDRHSGEIKQWEGGENRFCPASVKEGSVVIADIEHRFGFRAWRGAGTAIPVFSLRSEDDFGVGEFYDLKKLVDWASLTGQCVLQLLPVNDTTMTRTWTDSYPYNANSTFALHPQFINLQAAGVVRSASFKALQAELNSLEQVDYERVNSLKTEFLRKAFAKKFPELRDTEQYKTFFADNSYWLRPYAVFCVLRDEFATADFSSWGAYAKYSESKVEEFCKAHPQEVEFHYFVQYHLDRQLSEVREYAHSRGVVLKGDLPIGISRTSVDAWQYPKLFNMNGSAGAPPDAFAAEGQNWGFPTYNWEEMSKDGYSWWKARMRKMSEYFDVFRIDHILGFFRIWEIPLDKKSGLLGHFRPALPYSSEELARQGFDVASGAFVTPPGDDPTDVLFVEDPQRQGYWHPRISAQNARVFACLDYARQQAFNRLHDDFFYRRHNDFWRESAMSKLPSLLHATGMLACGEDLGMIPDCVASVMEDQKILSLEIQRMPKSTTVEFADPSRYPYLCVCTTSTHDMNPLRAWWEEDRELSQRFYNTLFCGQAPYFCEPWLCKCIVSQHLCSPAMLTILPLQDYLSIDGSLRKADPSSERINVPAESRHYWRYRMHISLEALLKEDSFNEELREMILSSGR